MTLLTSVRHRFVDSLDQKTCGKTDFRGRWQTIRSSRFLSLYSIAIVVENRMSTVQLLLLYHHKRETLTSRFTCWPPKIIRRRPAGWEPLAYGVPAAVTTEGADLQDGGGDRSDGGSTEGAYRRRRKRSSRIIILIIIIISIKYCYRTTHH